MVPENTFLKRKLEVEKTFIKLVASTGPTFPQAFQVHLYFVYYFIPQVF